MAAVRCRLKEYSGNSTASHAFIEVGIKGKKWFGMADRGGNAAVYFPYPTVDNAYSGTSPPMPDSRSLNSHKWPLSVRISYSPASLTPTFSTITDESYPGEASEKALPDLHSILR
jgi:hypothetical protein